MTTRFLLCLIFLGAAGSSLTACERHDKSGKRVKIPVPAGGITQVLQEDRLKKQREEQRKRLQQMMRRAQPRANRRAPNPQGTNNRIFRVAGIRWTSPAGWKQLPSRIQMRLTTYQLPGKGATCKVNFFGKGRGGSVEANLKRWIGQFVDPNNPGKPPKARLATRQASGIKIHTLEMVGTFKASRGPMFRGRARKGQRMLGAIAVAPQAPVFFKCTGPEATVAAARPAFYKLLDSIQPDGTP